jgi:Flp pilus assembly protein TadD
MTHSPVPDEPTVTAAPGGGQAPELDSQLLQRADGLVREGLGGAAIPVYRELLRNEPQQVEARLHLARLLDQRDEHDEAISVLTQGLEATHDQTEFLLLRGSILARRLRYEESETDLRHLLRLYPSHAPGHFELGMLLWRRGLVIEAAAHFQRALEFQPDNARTYYYLADALNQAGDLVGAHSALKRALQVDPNEAKAYHLIGRVLDRMGRPEEAREMYCRAKELVRT